MVGIKKRTQRLKNSAKISAQSRQEKQKIPEDNEIYDSANSDDFEEMISYFDEEFENNSESLFQLLINNMKNYKAKRPLTYHGNSTRTQKRRKASTKENINKNGQTLDQFFILEKNSSKEMTQDNDSQNIEIKLDESFDIAKSYNLRLKALQYYFQLLKRNHKKFEAANLANI
ncbi:5110_t:CDS:2 [Entrophospora sp. SA101]|nr:5110_t:CDS:2 [Entrophospora sp. SA101]